MLQGIGGAGSGIVDGKLYVAGGRDVNNTNYDTLFIYDIATDTWSSGPSLPQGENAPGSAVAGGKLWLFGFGTPFAQYSPLGKSRYIFDLAPAAGATTLSYDPATSTWTTGPDMNVAKSFTSGSAVGNTLVSAGGRISDTASTNDTETLAVEGPPPPRHRRLRHRHHLHLHLHLRLRLRHLRHRHLLHLRLRRSGRPAWFRT